jgi:hypothetical protein
MPDIAKNTETAGLTPAASSDPLIDQAMVDLHIARRNLLIYPASHDQVKRSLSRAFQSLSTALARDETITLAVMKDGLAVNEKALGSNPAVISELAAVLKLYQIATLCFAKGLEPKELVSFLRVITADREKIIAQGGIAAVADSRKMSHIKIQTLDYSKLQLTEESEIQRSSRRHGNGSIWQAFVTSLLSGGNQQKHNGETAAGVNLDPNELADMLNRQKVNPGAAIAHYEQVVAEAAHAGSGSVEVSEGLLLFQQMIKELNPDLQNQFLATTFDRCTQTADISNTANLVDGLGAELILRMLRQASSAGKQISPSLIAFVNKIGNLHTSTDNSPTGGGGSSGHTDGLSSQKIESLLNREQYDTYVDSDYSKLLNNLARKEQEADTGSGTKELVQGLAAEISYAGINAHAGRAMTRLMTTSADVAGYRDWARQLAYLLDDLLETQAFDYLIELMALVRAEKAGEDKERSEIASLLLDRFSDPQFVARTIETVQKAGGDLSPETLGFLIELGEPVVLEIFDGLDPSLTLHDEEVFTKILKNLSSITAQEALERIKDPRPEYVCRMLKIIQKMGDNESAQQVRSLLDHSNLEVRMEALSTLLKFNNSWGLIRLREYLARPLEVEFKPALQLAGEYRVQAMVPQLLLFFEQRGDAQLREATLRALGRIGDCRAIPVLTKLAYRRWSISKKQTGHLKRVLYETLGGYPLGEVKHLLHFGLKQKDDIIQSACQKLLREGTREADG